MQQALRAGQAIDAGLNRDMTVDAWVLDGHENTDVAYGASALGHGTQTLDDMNGSTERAEMALSWILKPSRQICLRNPADLQTWPGKRSMLVLRALFSDANPVLSGEIPVRSGDGRRQWP